MWQLNLEKHNCAMDYQIWIFGCPNWTVMGRKIIWLIAGGIKGLGIMIVKKLSVFD